MFRGDQNGGAEAALKTPTAAATPKPPTPPATSADAGARKTIPRLIDVAPAQRREALVGVAPLEWSVHDVVHFLRVNDCAACCDAFLDAVSRRILMFSLFFLFDFTMALFRFHFLFSLVLDLFVVPLLRVTVSISFFSCREFPIHF